MSANNVSENIIGAPEFGSCELFQYCNSNIGIFLLLSLPLAKNDNYVESREAMNQLTIKPDTRNKSNKKRYLLGK